METPKPRRNVTPSQSGLPRDRRNPHCPPGCTCHWRDGGPDSGGWQRIGRDIGCPVAGHSGIYPRSPA